MSDDASAKKERWVSGWVKEESFWRDVFIRTISGMIAGVLVIVIGYVYAVISGYISGPRWLDNIGNLLAFLTIGAAVICLALLVSLAIRNKRQGKKIGQWIVAMIFIVVLIGAIILEATTNEMMLNERDSGIRSSHDPSK